MNIHTHVKQYDIYYDLCYDVMPYMIYDKIFDRKYDMVYDIKDMIQAQLGVPHSDIQVKLD